MIFQMEIYVIVTFNWVSKDESKTYLFLLDNVLTQNCYFVGKCRNFSKVRPRIDLSAEGTDSPMFETENLFNIAVNYFI